MTSRPFSASTAMLTSQRLLPDTAFGPGERPGGSTRTNGSSAKAASYVACTSAADTSFRSVAYEVTMMPRVSGTRCGTKVMPTFSPATSSSAATVS
jgi:hypothetical protein